MDTHTLVCNYLWERPEVRWGVRAWVESENRWEPLDLSNVGTEEECYSKFSGFRENGRACQVVKISRYPVEGKIIPLSVQSSFVPKS